jgi:hypothetical protein
MRVMGVTEGAEGDTEVAAPLLRVAVGASTALAFTDAPLRGPAMRPPLSCCPPWPTDART